MERQEVEKGIRKREGKREEEEKSVEGGRHRKRGR